MCSISKGYLSTQPSINQDHIQQSRIDVQCKLTQSQMFQKNFAQIEQKWQKICRNQQSILYSTPNILKCNQGQLYLNSALRHNLFIMSKKLTKFGQTFVSYGSYHYNPVNQWIHIICVPVIACTLFSLIGYIPLTYNFNGWVIGLDAPFLIFTAIFYLRINFAFGVGMTVLMSLLTVGWKAAFADVSQEPSFFKWVITAHTVAWILQFIGHGVFEKRRPALLDSLPEVLSAPLFVLVEIIMKLGIKTQEMDYWMELVEKRVAQYREKNKIK